MNQDIRNASNQSQLPSIKDSRNTIISERAGINYSSINKNDKSNEL